MNGSFHRITCLLLAIMIACLVFGITLADEVKAADEYDTLRDKYKLMLTGGTTYDPSDPKIAARIHSITVTAQGYWDTMHKQPDRNRLWNDAPFGNDSSGITNTYNHLKDMALAYTTHGSTLEGNAALKADIIDGLEWMNNNQFFEGCTKYQNWWHWEIGGPLALNDIVALMYSDLTEVQVADYMAAVAYTQPSVTMTGANRLWESQVIAISGINNKDAVRIMAGRDGISALLPYVAKGDGFYTDGSFVQHNYYAYNGGYGAGLLSGISDLMFLLKDSTWAITDPEQVNVYQWVYDSYEPFIYKGNLMDMVRGREISRHGLQDDQAAIAIIVAIIRLSQIAEPGDAEAFQSMVKYWLEEHSEHPFLDSVPIHIIVSADQILNDPTIISREEQVMYRQFAGMDRALLLRPGFGFGISMFSSRIGNYEAINAENNKGWYTGNGMTYLYNNDLSQYHDHFWPTVNNYRLAGTTVLQNTTQSANNRSANNWTGGANMLDQYGVSGMQLQTVGKNLTANKSWFMFDDEIVALGAGISSTDGIPVETIVENRKLGSAGDNTLSVDGSVKSSTLGWSETMMDIQAVHLAGNVPGSDIGYYFPGGATINGLREARSGSWNTLNSSINWRDSTLHTRNYMTLWLDHGINPTNDAYSYVLLPNKTGSELGSYVSAPDISILENSTTVQAVKENQLNIVGINFWKDITATAGLVTSDKKASVMTRETASEYEVSVADPTQSNVGSIYIDVNKSATGLIAKDDEITVIQYHPTIKFKVNTHKLGGRTSKIKFSLTGTPSDNPPPIPIPNPYEAELLPIHALTSTPVIYNDVNASGGKKLGFNNNAVDQYVEFSLDVPQAGIYDITGRVMKASNNGIYQVSINGAQIGSPQDTYWNTSEQHKDFNFGSYDFSTPGSYLIRFTTVGKNISASGFKLSLDYVSLHSPLPEIDVQAPSAPTDVTARGISSNAILLNWSPSTDNVEVIGYRIYRDGMEIGTTTSTTYHDTGLMPATSYSYTVRAFDAADNLSLPSNTATISTLGSNRYEAEVLAVNEANDTHVVKSHTAASGGLYRLFNGREANDYIAYEVQVPEAGSYHLTLKVMRFSDNGIYQLQINDGVLSAPFDMYRSSGSALDVDLGQITLSQAGTQLFTFIAADKNEDSFGYKLPLDYIQLEPVEMD